MYVRRPDGDRFSFQAGGRPADGRGQGLLQVLIPALLALRIVPALETKGAGYFTHLPVPVVAADIRSKRHVRDQELLVPAGEVQVPSPHSTGIALGKSKKLGDIVEGSSEFVRLNLAIDHGLHQRSGPGEGRDKLDVLFRNHAARYQVVTRAIEDELGRRQVAERPALLTQPGQADAGRRSGIADRQHEVAGALLTASDNGNCHDVHAVFVKYSLELVEAARRAVVNRLSIEKTHELIEVGAEGNSRIVNKPPCWVEVRPRNIGSVETCPPAKGPPAPTAATISLNVLGIAGVGAYLVNLTCPALPRAVVEMLSSLAAYSSAGGPIAAEPLKLRKEISSARADCAAKKIAQTNAATAAPKRNRSFV